MKQRHILIVSIPIASVLILMVGCSSDSRLGDLAQQVTHEQAAQNQRMAESTQRIAQGSQQLIDADAKARRELIQMQNGLRQDQAELAKQRDALEIARAEVAEDRLTDSQVANCIIAVGVLIAAIAPLVLAGISLVGLWREPSREEEGHVLIEELTRELIADQVPPIPRLVQNATGELRIQGSDADGHRA
ncbi:hypothetical protein ETAA8_18150 [Anatilimnocola aggregata]|uniref:Uncharacterized protein n=1 Tax=Anatilimnocola aggregata TaxID=2528021 RepID=A0A517Y919_9BACT|nr:hypothetical protein [Anatilimnocola aggregata]QDU26734.1 hypothetical protein ETAA8_18150 [Anatilimnocola aggregata]